jgi:hypothetical protein
MGETFSISSEGFDLFTKYLKAYPKIQKEYAYKLVNAQAAEFKETAWDLISSHYTIRDEHFVRDLALRVEKAKTVQSIDDIEATVGSVSENFSERYKGFGGWLSPITGQPESGRERNRFITKEGRGGSYSGKAAGWARWHRGGEHGGYYPTPSTFTYNRRTLKSGKKAKLSTVKLSGGGESSKKTVPFIMMMKKLGYQGLFRLSRDDDPRFSNGLYTVRNGRLEQIQRITDSPMKQARRWDWVSECIERVSQVFTESKIWTDFVAPALDKAAKSAK